MTAAEAGTRAPGRPRSTEADDAILEAAIELFAETGFEGLTVEAVAARAGVGKATVYRRYSCKVELVAAACRAYADLGGESPDTGTLRDDLRALLGTLVDMLTDSPVGRVMPTLVADKARIPELAAEQRALVREKRRHHRAVMERAVGRGELRPDVDPELVIAAVVGPVFYRF
ncbi:MAG TPA: TetR/AcrR family transcriptional regulator, partial [Gaiellaceae bacterium]|nr:TetR/AcrR family transcriptional regulator [Gaiellaceae bacterium]